MLSAEGNSMFDGEGGSLFAFHDLDYIPFGFSSDTAPYIETPIATMRAAATLMRLDPDLYVDAIPPQTDAANIVVCDLGCGDGELRNGQLFLLRSQCQVTGH
jgi:hypothetical protein